MGEQRHVIKRQVLAFTAADTEQAHHLQAEMGRIYRQRLVPLIDQSCTALSEPDRLHRIALLELDLGVVDPHHLERDLVAKVKAQLPQLLERYLTASAPPAENGSGESSKTTSQLELFSLFARHGSVPWWADISQPRLIDASLRHLVRHAPAPLRRLMQQLVRQPNPLKRIVSHVEPDTLADLAGLLAPDHAAVLPPFATALTALLPDIPHTSGWPAAQTHTRVWSTVLEVVGILGAQAQTPLTLCGGIVSRLAKTLGMRDTALLPALRQAAQSNPIGRDEPFREIAEALDQAQPQAASAPDVRLMERLAQWRERDGWLAALARALPPLTPRA